MKYVLDASVAIRWELPNALTPKALQLRDDFRNQIHELIAPFSPISHWHANG